MKTNGIGYFISLSCIIALLVIIAPGTLHGQSDPLIRHAMVRVQPVTDYEAFAPSPLPDRIALTWSGDPATTQVVSWRTDTSVERAFGEIALSTDGPLFWYKTHWAETRPLETNLGVAHYHSVEFTGLGPLRSISTGSGTE